MERARGKIAAICAGAEWRGSARSRHAGETAPSRQGLATLGRNCWERDGPVFRLTRVRKGEWAYLWIRLIVAEGMADSFLAMG